MSKTLIFVILDESGSMNGKKDDVIGGFNSFIEEQKNIKTDQSRFFMIKFNSNVFPIHNNIKLEYVPPLTNENYRPSGNTALYDAVYKAILTVDEYKEKDERIVIVIFTDGLENSSKVATKHILKEMITSREASGEWTFLYIGENPFQWSQDTGTDITDGIQYDHLSPNKSFESASQALSKYRLRDLKKKGYNLFDVL
jgi:uncharacterized protein YegL